MRGNPQISVDCHASPASVVSRIGRQLRAASPAPSKAISPCSSPSRWSRARPSSAPRSTTAAPSCARSLQAALDSAALMVSKDLIAGHHHGHRHRHQGEVLFQRPLHRQRTRRPATSSRDLHRRGRQRGSRISQLTASGRSDRLHADRRLSDHGFNTTSTTAWGNTRMRVAMILDNTGSMAQNGKMTAMQNAAAKDMIDTLSGYNKQTGDVYISIIPFSKDVNVDTANRRRILDQLDRVGGRAADPRRTTRSNSFNSAIGRLELPVIEQQPGLHLHGPARDVSGANSVNNDPVERHLSRATSARALTAATNSPGKSSIYYNGCYTTVDTAASAQAAASNTSCTCTGSGSSKICHLWRGDGTAATAAAAPAHSTWTGCVNDRDQNYDTLEHCPGLEQLDVPLQAVLRRAVVRPAFRPRCFR